MGSNPTLSAGTWSALFSIRYIRQINGLSGSRVTQHRDIQRVETMSEHLVQRAGVFYFRRRIPSDLRALYAPSREIRRSLGRLEFKAAAVLARAASVEWDERFARARATGKPCRASESEGVFLTAEEIERYAAAWTRWRLCEDDAVRRAGYTSDLLAEAAAATLADLDHAKRALALGDVTGIEAQLEDFSHAVGVPLPEGTNRRDLAFACLRAEVKALTLTLARDAGEPVETPPEPAPLPVAAGHTLRDVFKRWTVACKRPVKTVEDAERALRQFERFLGHTAPLANLRRDQGADFRAHLLALVEASGGKARTAKKALDWIKTLLNYAERDLQWVARNPWAGLSIDKPKGTVRLPWEPADLRILFGSDLFTAYAIPLGAKACLDAAYWAPLIAAYTGARISEIAQLGADDLIERAGVVCFAFRESSDQRLKTAAAVRDVPIHSELVRLGLLEYVRAIREHGAARLFPAVPVSAGRSGAGASISDWFGDYKTARGFSGPAKVFHSFRHSVRSMLTDAGIAEPVIDRLLGHESTGSEGARTYTRISIPALHRAVEAIVYQGLELPRVFTQPAWSPGMKVGHRVT
ncbi:MAG: site-specific integrase [Burkholderiales bacterium]|nr:site-specific integrase [Burkholderiales bacterium]